MTGLPHHPTQLFIGPSPKLVLFLISWVFLYWNLPGTGMKPWPSLSKTLNASRISSSISLSWISLESHVDCVNASWIACCCHVFHTDLGWWWHWMTFCPNYSHGHISASRASVEFWSLISLFKRCQYCCCSALPCARNNVVTKKNYVKYPHIL